MFCKGFLASMLSTGFIFVQNKLLYFRPRMFRAQTYLKMWWSSLIFIAYTNEEDIRRFPTV